MKKTIVLSILLIASTVSAASYRGTSEALRIPGTQVIKVFEGYTAVNVPIIINPDFLPDQGGWQVVVHGAPTSWSLSIEGSLVNDVDEEDRPYWPISTITGSSLDRLRFWNSKPIPFHRVIITNKVGSGSFDLYMIKRGN